jgi:protein-tyrosine phosphatase
VLEQLVVGRRLLDSEIAEEFVNYVDLTSEFSELSKARKMAGYVCFPILDAGAPSPDSLKAAVKSLRPGKTYVHCAQGHGRTGLFALALLLTNGLAGTPEDGLRMLRHARPGINLNRQQRRCIELLARS